MLAIVVLTAALGNWQLNRASDRLAAQALQDQLGIRGPVQLTAHLTNAGVLAGRPVTITGRWLHDKTVFLDNRSYKRQGGFHVFTPLRIVLPEPAIDRPMSAEANEPVHVLVLRGWTARDVRDRMALPALPTNLQSVVVTGLGEGDVEQSMVLGTDSEPSSEQRLWQRVDLIRFQQWSGLKLVPLLIRQIEADQSDPRGESSALLAEDGLIRDWITPGSKVDRHYGYAFQWFAMSLAMLSFWLWLKFFRRHPRPRKSLKPDISV